MDPDVDSLTVELVRLYATSPLPTSSPVQQQQQQEQQQTTEAKHHHHQHEELALAQQPARQTSTDSGADRCEDALDELVRELHAENLQLRRRLRAAEAEHGHRVRCLVDTLDRMQKEVAEISSRKAAAVKRPKSDCTDQATPACCHGNGYYGQRQRSISISEDARELASALAQVCQELRSENACLMQQLRQLRSRASAATSRASQRRRDLRRCQAEEELTEVREELHRLRVAVLEASVRFPGVEALLLKP